MMESGADLGQNRENFPGNRGENETGRYKIVLYVVRSTPTYSCFQGKNEKYFVFPEGAAYHI